MSTANVYALNATTPVQIAAATGPIVIRTFSEDVYIGPSNVTAQTGVLIPHHSVVGMDTFSDTLYAILDEGTGAVAVLQYTASAGSGTVAGSVGITNWIGSTAPTVGQKAMADSLPVAIASDQSPVPVSSTQLPAALVGGRLDGNTGAWLGSTAPSVGQKPMASSVPVVLASDYQVQGVTAPAAVAALTTNVIPLVRYNATPPTATDGQVGALQTDINLNLKTREQYTDIGSFLPSFSTALEKSRVISAAPADLLEYALEIDSAATTATYWLWIINANGVPSDGTAIGSIAALQLPRAIAHTNGTKTIVPLTSFRFGVRGSTAITLALSSNASQFTFTLVGTAWVAFSAMYRLF